MARLDEDIDNLPQADTVFNRHMQQLGLKLRMTREGIVGDVAERLRKGGGGGDA